MTEWQPIDTAPKDGTKILLTWMDGGQPQETYLMQWDACFTNGLYPGVNGFWVTPCRSVTWISEGEGAPTHWSHAHEFNN